MIPKFRVWDDENKVMWNIERWHIEDEYFDLIEPNKSVVDLNAKRTWRKQRDAILMQSTGMFDKNDVEIFEGDIVKCYTVTEKCEYEYVGVVCLKDFAFVIVDEKDTYDPLWNYKSGFVGIETEIEIIGNVFENPELVEVNNVDD